MPSQALNTGIGWPLCWEARASTAAAGVRYGTWVTSGIFAITRCAGVIVVSCVISAWYCVVNVATGVMLLGVPVMSAISASLLPIQRKMVVGCALMANPSWLRACP